jgi:hypothetical protein
MQNPRNICRLLPDAALKVISHIGGWTDRTRPIVRLDLVNRMVTKGYQKGVYERVTKGIERRVPPHSA